jgi:hypothetical protein
MTASPSPLDPTGGIRFNPFDGHHRFDGTRCLISGRGIDPSSELRSVFPDRWVERLGLGQHALTMPNGSKVTYGELRLPVHQDCWESGIDYIARKCPNLVLAGTDTLGWTSSESIYQWLSWLFMGVLYAEMYAAQGQAEIHPAWNYPSYLNRYRMIHLGLQGAVYPIQYLGYDPGSVFILQMSQDPCPFDFKTSSNTQTLALQVSGSAILASLGDNGAHLAFFEDEFLPLRKMLLDPVQVDEIYARMCYRNHLLNPVFEYGIAYADKEEPTTLVQMRIPEQYATEEAFRPWSDAEYVRVLDLCLARHGHTPLLTWQESGEIMTFLE